MFSNAAVGSGFSLVTLSVTDVALVAVQPDGAAVSVAMQVVPGASTPTSVWLTPPCAPAAFSESAVIVKFFGAVVPSSKVLPSGKVQSSVKSTSITGSIGWVVGAIVALSIMSEPVLLVTSTEDPPSAIATVWPGL